MVGLPPLEIGRVLPLMESFLAEALDRPGIGNGILGLSGGIDSAVVAALMVQSVGPARTRLVYMPHEVSNDINAADARDLAGMLGVELLEVPITGMTGGYPGFDALDAVRAGNLMARMRMSILYDLSAEHSALVIGTSNRTEILLGYGTLFGDTACAVNPIGDLYKTWIRELAGALGIPESIRLKAPSADLWVGQTDEEELGIDYATADRILYHLVDHGRSVEETVELGFDADLVRGVVERMEQNAFKRRLPEICRLFGEPDALR